MKNIKILFLLLGIFIVSLLLAIPAVRIYEQYFFVAYGADHAFALGFLLSFYSLYGMVLGYLYDLWYKSFLRYIFLILMIFIFWSLLTGSVLAAIILLGLSIAGYVLGYGIRRVIDFLFSNSQSSTNT